MHFSPAHRCSGCWVQGRHPSGDKVPTPKVCPHNPHDSDPALSPSLVPLTGSGHLDGTRLCPTCSACPHLCPFPCSQNHTCPSGLRSRTCPALLASPDPLCVPRAARSRLCCRVLVSQNCKEQSLSCFIIPGERSGSEAVMFPTVPYGLFVCSFLCFASKGKTSVHRFEKKKQTDREVKELE